MPVVVPRYPRDNADNAAFAPLKSFGLQIYLRETTAIARGNLHPALPVPSNRLTPDLPDNERY